LKTIFGCSITVLILVSAPLQAQWAKVPPANIPQTLEGKPDLSAAPPRLPDGRPDLSGLWKPANVYGGKPANFAANLQVDDIPYQPWAKALLDERKNGAQENDDSSALCLPQGVPRMVAAPGQWRLIQKPEYIAIMYEAFGILWRQIFLDGREVTPDAPPSWMGYSTGKWDGNTLVVDTKGFNGRFWLDQQGKPTTDALHVTERYQRKDFGHMDIEITIDDAKAYTRPWTFMEHMVLLTDTELMEAICNENNLDLEHIPGVNQR
jgi:hypothetical protein